MDFAGLIDLIRNLDEHLAALAQAYGPWIYAILFAIIFCETGLVVTPFLPGDSLLFVAGAVAAAGSGAEGLASSGPMNVHLLVVVLVVAAILGNQVNYEIGRWIGPRVYRIEDRWYFKRKYLDQTRAFYDRHGGKTITISRFVPIVRTYAPFVAGVSHMDRTRFAMFNIFGGLFWVVSLVYAGYFFGNIAWVKSNLGLVIVAIIIASIMPAVIAYLRTRGQAVRQS
jgi:membrane-associated protein